MLGLACSEGLLVESFMNTNNHRFTWVVSEKKRRQLYVTQHLVRCLSLHCTASDTWFKFLIKCSVYLIPVTWNFIDS